MARDKFYRDTTQQAVAAVRSGNNKQAIQHLDRLISESADKDTTIDHIVEDWAGIRD